MNSVEILRKAIEKAEAHGFTGLTKGWDVDIWKRAGLDDHSEPYVKEPAGAGDYRAIPWQVILFNYDFAKALWGETSDTMTVQNNSINVKQIIDMNGWRYHLQQLVIVDDPFEYLEQNINKRDNHEIQNS